MNLVIAKISPSTIEGDVSVLVKLVHTSEGINGFGASKKSYYVSHKDGKGLEIGQGIDFDMSLWTVEQKQKEMEIEKDGNLVKETMTFNHLYLKQ